MGQLNVNLLWINAKYLGNDHFPWRSTRILLEHKNSVSSGRTSLCDLFDCLLLRLAVAGDVGRTQTTTGGCIQRPWTPGHWKSPLEMSKDPVITARLETTNDIGDK